MANQRSGPSGCIELNTVIIPPYMSINMSLFLALNNHHPPSLLHMGSNTTSVDSLDTLMRKRDAILDDLRFHFLKAQHRMKKWVHAKCRHESFDDIFRRRSMLAS